MRKVGVAAVVFAALLLLADLPSFIGGGVSILTSSGAEVAPPYAIVLATLPAVTAIAIFLGLIAGRHQLAQQWFDDGDVDISVGPVPLLRIALIVAGVLLVADAIPSVLLTLASAVTTSAAMSASGFAPDQSPVTFWLLNLSAVIYPLVRLGLGLALVGWSQPLAVRLWEWRPAKPAQGPVDDKPECASCGAPYEPGDYRQDAESWRCSKCGEPLDPRVPNKGIEPTARAPYHAKDA